MKNISANKPSWWIYSLITWQELSHYFFLKGISSSDLSAKKSWQKIKNGISNYNYKLSISNDTYFVQIIKPSNNLLLPEKAEKLSPFYFNHSSLNKWLVTNYFNSKNLIIHEWFFSSEISSNLFDHKLFTENIVDFICKLHSFNKNALPDLAKLDIEKHLNKYKTLAIKNNSTSIRSDIETLFQLAQNHSTSFKSSHICHNDLSLTNILWKTECEELKIIDWEYACISDPILDLANLILNCQLNDQQEDILLRSYERKMDVSISQIKLSDMKILSQSLSKLWQLAQ